MLKNFVFVHLESADSKFNLLMQMLHKLYALVNFQCCDDNPDALSHHEILLPGQLLAKYFKEKVEDSLSEFVQQVHCRLSHAARKRSVLGAVSVAAMHIRMNVIAVQYWSVLLRAISVCIGALKLRALCVVG